MVRIVKLLGILALGLFLSGCARQVEEAGVLRIGNGGEPRDLDPHVVTGTPEVRIILSLMEGLLAHHPTDDRIPYGGVAERWELDEAGTQWDFYLRENARWSNGDPLTAEDFVYAWRRVITPELGNEYADWLYIIEGAEDYHKEVHDDFTTVGVTAVGPHHLRVNLREPSADFLKIILNHTFLPVHRPTIEAHGGIGVRKSGWTRPESFVGNGAFRLVRWDPHVVIRVEPNPHYWDASTVRLRAVEFYPIEDENAALRAFESGQLHATTTVPVNLRQHYFKTNPESIRMDPLAGVYFYRINTLREPLTDVRVRRALSLAIDRKLIIEQLLKGGERPAISVVPEGTEGYQLEWEGLEGYNPEKARSLLAEAGFPNGEGFPVVELLFNTSDNHRKLAEAVQSMWEDKLGVRIRLTNQEWKVYLDSSSAMDFDLCRAGWVGSLYPASFLRVFTSESSNNETGFADPEFDRLIREGMRTLDQEARFALLMEAERRLLTAQAVIPLYWYTNVYLMSPRVLNWTPKYLDYRPWKLVDIAPQG
jgi:oligopeptide transport system substrate-binding protein